jgi:hypothetical protein
VVYPVAEYVSVEFPVKSQVNTAEGFVDDTLHIIGFVPVHNIGLI